MSKLTFAIGQYDRTIPLFDGTVRLDGVELDLIPALGVWPAPQLHLKDLFRRQGRDAVFDIAEFSLSTYCILHAQGDRRLVAIPVFPSQRFRHSYIFVNKNSGIREPKDLIGKRMGVQEYQQTACVWLRGILQEHYDVRPEQMEWYFGGFNQPTEWTPRVDFTFHRPLPYKTIASDQSLNDLLERGEIDALMGARKPRCFEQGSPNVGRLFPNFADVELQYYRETGIIPIMHIVVIKREIYEKQPDLVEKLFAALCEAKRLGLARLAGGSGMYASLPWLPKYVEETQELFGNKLFQYGMEANRKVLETFLRYHYEQGLTPRQLEVEELFAPETHHLVDPMSNT